METVYLDTSLDFCVALMESIEVTWEDRKGICEKCDRRLFDVAGGDCSNFEAPKGVDSVYYNK